MPEADAAALASPASPRALFVAFTRLAMQGFGGVLPVAQRELVERQRWMSKAEFLELLAAGQVLPGPNIVNLALMYGDRCFGWRGAVAATTGILLAPMLLVLALAVLYAEFVHLSAVAGALRGMGAVAAGLVLATGFKLMGSLRQNVLGRRVALVYAALTVAAIAGLRLPLVLVIAVLGGSAIAWAAARLRAEATKP